MKNVIISSAVVAVLAAAVCIFSVCTVERVCSEMDALRTEAQQAAQAGQTDRAAECLGRMRQYWEAQCGMLNSILPHSAVEEITAVLIEGRADLAAQEADGFAGDMMLLGELLHRLRKNERLIPSNILCIC